MELLLTLWSRPLLIFLVLTPAFSGFFQGLDAGCFSTSLIIMSEDMKLKSNSSTTHSKNSSTEILIQGSAPSAAIIGTLMATFGFDHVGPKRGLISSSALVCLGFIFNACAGNIPILLVGRILSGLGFGASTFFTIIYTNDIGPNSIRGSLLSAFGAMMSLGSFIASLNDNDYWRRLVFGFGAVLALAQTLSMMLLKESPRYLWYSKGDLKKAEENLRSILSEEELVVVVEQMKNYHAQKCKRRGCLKDLVFIRGCICCVVCFLASKVSGFDSVIYIFPNFLQKAHLGAQVTSMAVTLIPGIINGVSFLAGFLIVDRVGRRKVMLCSLIFILVCNCVLWYICHSSAPNLIGLITTLIFMAVYSPSVGNFPWIVVGEVYTPRRRQFGMGFSLSIYWTLTLATGLNFLNLKEALGSGGFYGVNSVGTLVALLLVHLLLPDTRDSSLELVEDAFKNFTPWPVKKKPPSNEPKPPNDAT